MKCIWKYGDASFIEEEERLNSLSREGYLLLRVNRFFAEFEYDNERKKTIHVDNSCRYSVLYCNKGDLENEIATIEEYGYKWIYSKERKRIYVIKESNKVENITYDEKSMLCSRKEEACERMKKENIVKGSIFLFLSILLNILLKPIINSYVEMNIYEKNLIICNISIILLIWVFETLFFYSLYKLSIYGYVKSYINGSTDEKEPRSFYKSDWIFAICKIVVSLLLITIVVAIFYYKLR